MRLVAADAYVVASANDTGRRRRALPMTDVSPPIEEMPNVA